MIRLRSVVLSALLACLPLAAQELPARLSPEARISLLTVTPGADLYATFGHSAIRIVDPAAGLDRIYNYGTFDFEEPGFYVKFTRGKLDYALSAYPYRYARAQYRSERRTVTEQILRLTPQRAQALYDFLEWNHRPENRRYRYDFFFDNCATRIRDVFERVIGDSLRLAYRDDWRMTFREHIDHYLVAHPFSDFGIDLALGAGTDRVAAPREALFLPDYLFRSVAGAETVVDGLRMPLVAETAVILEPADPYVLRAAIPWALILMTALAMAAVLLTVTHRWLGRGAPRWLDLPLFLLVGILGALITSLWFFTDHRVTPDNLNLFWLWPTHLLVAPALLARRPGDWQRWYFRLAGAAVVVMMLGWPIWPQAFHPAAFPFMIALLVRCADRAVPPEAPGGGA